MLIKLLIILSNILQTFFDQFLNHLDASQADRPLPDNIKDVYDEEEYRKWRAYNKERDRVSLTEAIVEVVISTGLLAFNVYAIIFKLLGNMNLYLQYLIFIAGMSLVTTIISIPFSHHRTFVIEEKYGMNKSTKKTFVLDVIKGFLIDVVVSYALMAVIMLFYEKFGNVGMIGVIIALVVILLLINLIVVPLMRVFNKFEPLPDGESGVLAVTDLNTRVQPRLRYLIGDVATLREDSCSCKIKLPLISDVSGREDDILVRMDGSLAYGVFVSSLARYYTEVYQIRLIQHSKEKATLYLVMENAPEVANNAVTGGALIPALSLGIPGDSATAVLIGALMINGLTPGFALFSANMDIVYSIFITLFIANVFMAVFQLAGVRLYPKVLLISQKILMPIVLMLSFIGAYALAGASVAKGIYNIITALLMGLVGYVLKKNKYPIAPIVLGFILGGMFEEQFRKAVKLGAGTMNRFVSSPICWIFTLLSLAIVVSTVIKNKKEEKKNA